MVSALAYGALGGLVVSGALTGLDQWAIRHAMPGAHGAGRSPTLAESIVPLLHARAATPLVVAAQAVTLPGQVVVSALLVAGVGVVLARHGRRRAAWTCGTAWLLASAIEVICKATLVRPALYRHGFQVGAFDASWPSGHAVRASIVAAAVAAAWPRLRLLLALWLAAVAALLEAGGFHTPSDIAGGLLLAAFLVETARAVERSGALRGRATAGGPTGSGPRAAPRRR